MGINFNTDSISTNQYTPAIRYTAVPENLWQFDFSNMSPQDSLGTYNDGLIYNFSCDASNWLNTSSALSNYFMPMIERMQANMSSQYQKMMMALSANNAAHFDFNEGTLRMPTISRNGRKGRASERSESYADKLKDSQVNKTINDLIASDDEKIKGAMNEKVKLENGEEVSIGDRLKQLCKEYVDYESGKSDVKPQLSSSEFQQIKEILGKYAKTGEIRRSDLETLKDIVKDHLGETEEGNSEGKVIARSKNNVTERATIANIKSISDEIYEATDGAGTDWEVLVKATDRINKNNVLEVIQAFNKKNMQGSGDEIIKQILDDCNGWAGGSNGFWTFGMANQDARPSITSIANALKGRVKDLKESGGLNDSQKTELDNLVTNMASCYSDTECDRNSMKTNTVALYQKLIELEETVYGDFDKEQNLTNEDLALV